MKLVTFGVSTPFGEVRRLGSIRDDGIIVDLVNTRELQQRGKPSHSMCLLEERCYLDDMLSFIKMGDRAREVAEEVMMFASNLDEDDEDKDQDLVALFKPTSVRLLAPLTKPNSIRCFSLSEKHMLDGIASMQDVEAWGGTEPSLLSLPPEWYNLPTYYKTTTTEIYGPDDVIPWPHITDKFDYELELGMVIGKRGRHVAEEDAENYIFGYTLYNDWSARDFQNREMSVNLGPGLCKDNASSIGPCIVTHDEFPLNDAKFSVKVNGVLWAETKVDFHFSLNELIEYITRVQTIFPGDIFTTGTLPGGSGAERKRWIPEGATVELIAEGMGVLRNRVGMKNEITALPASQKAVRKLSVGRDI